MATFRSRLSVWISLLGCLFITSQSAIIESSSNLNSDGSMTTTSSSIIDDKSNPLGNELVDPKPETNTTSSNANVFEATPISNQTGKDPLQVNAQQQNPFISGAGGLGGINPQIALLLQNNPRLQMLARQNPIIAQQIMRNPQLLRDPMIQRAIQSQLNPGQGQNLLGQIGQLGLNGLNGLGRALNPLGGFSGGQQMNSPLNNGFNQANLANRFGGGGVNGGLNQNPRNNRHFGLPLNNNNRQQNFRSTPHQDIINGGYYGDNNNYANPSTDTNEIDDGSDGTDSGADENPSDNENGLVDPGQQDYGDNTGEDNGQEGMDDSQQNPAEDPDIQQLQNFGGPINDNFPEGLFPPGLLSKEDIKEIRRQQEKQQREDEERERLRQQQQQQQQNSNNSQDYDDGTGNAGADEENVEYPEGEDQSGGNEVDANQQNGLEDQNGIDDQQTDQITTPVPAFQNSYQPIDPSVESPKPPALGLKNEYRNSVENQPGGLVKNQFNSQSDGKKKSNFYRYD
ncbi:hypothetical protein QR98_0039820 [Sarcoptes scabiei]|uniref:Uncharacterized protein n=1 Tax=Sarcoptes scabiei TaxID=52283 RepID=A0A132A3F0_SARSC|nr:hypothetical protein QR98_0039820 [Sarcoptes scabiei]